MLESRYLNADDLIGCPICGRKPVIRIYDFIEDPNDSCEIFCGVWTEDGKGDHLVKVSVPKTYSPEEAFDIAVNLWNTRAEIPFTD